MTRWAAALIVAGALAGCGSESEPPSNGSDPAGTAATQQPDSPQAPGGDEAAETNRITAHVRVIDLEGEPLAGMMPIATRKPNAFEEPLARGPETNAEGEASFRIELDQRLYVRVWDPGLEYFANNYFEVLPADGTDTDWLEITMVRGAELSATILLPGGAPAPNAPVELYLDHPTKGPWWPDKTTTNANGRLVFESVPAGQYTARLKIPGTAGIEVPSVALKPGTAQDLGQLRLQPLAGE